MGDENSLSLAEAEDRMTTFLLEMFALVDGGPQFWWLLRRAEERLKKI